MKFSGVGLFLVLQAMVGLRIAAASRARAAALRVVFADVLRASVIASPCFAFCPVLHMDGWMQARGGWPS